MNSSPNVSQSASQMGFGAPSEVNLMNLHADLRASLAEHLYDHKREATSLTGLHPMTIIKSWM